MIGDYYFIPDNPPEVDHEGRLKIGNSKEMIMENLTLSHDQVMICQSSDGNPSRVTILGDCVLRSHSSIDCGHGKLILIVYGDLKLHRGAMIRALGGGQLFIKVYGSLTMKRDSMLKTCRQSNIPDWEVSRNEYKRSEWGNIHLVVEERMVMECGSVMNSGHIRVECKKLPIYYRALMSARRNNIDLRAVGDIRGMDLYRTPGRFAIASYPVSVFKAKRYVLGWNKIFSPEFAHRVLFESGNVVYRKPM